MNARFDPAGPLVGTITPPSDKSISHRAALFGAMASGATEISGYLPAADTLSTLSACRALGAGVRRDGAEVTIEGVAGRPRILDQPIDVGNAGTLMRLLPGWLATRAGEKFAFDGDASIRRRPVDRIAEPLTAMGARIDAREGRFPPFTVHGATLRPIAYRLPIPSAQVKSCVLLAGLAAPGTSVVEPTPSRDHTERMLLAAGVPVERALTPEGTLTTLAASSHDAAGRAGACTLAPTRIAVPADLSSAAFLIAAATLVPGSAVRLMRVGVNWTRTGFVRILGRMGAAIEGELEPPGAFGPAEPVSDLVVRAATLVATEVASEEVPLAIDELPLVALLGCFAEGTTVVRGAGELRLKESDRVTTVVEGLRGLGAEIEDTRDGFTVTGTGGLPGGTFDAHGDHRLAMLGAVAGLASRRGVEVVGMEAAAVSYPDFARDLAELGGGALA